MSTLTKNYGVFCVTAAFTVGILILDLAMPLGVAGGALYIAPVLTASMARRNSFVFEMAVATSLLTLVGYYYSPEGGIAWMVLTNRLLSLAVIWVTAIMAFRRNQATEALRLANEAAERRQNEVRLRLITDNIGANITYLDTDQRFRFVNKGFEDVFGLSSDEVIGKSVRELLGPETYQHVAPHIVAALGGEEVVFEHSRTGTDGVTRSYQSTYLPHFDEHGEVLGVYGLSVDITERTRVEAELRRTTQAAELLRKIAVAANHADNPDDAIRVCLDEVCAYSGWSVGHAYRFGPDGSGDLISTNLWHLDDPVRYEAFRRETTGLRVSPDVGMAGRALSHGKPYWMEVDPSDNIHPRRKVRIEAGLKSGFAVPVMVGRQVGAVLEFLTDEVVEEDTHLFEITTQVGVLIGRVIERQRNEQTLLDAKEEAELASRSKSEFLANMSHELRTPLNAINGFSELLAEEAFGPLGNEEYRKFSQHINESGQHLLALINDVLDISKIEAGGVDLSEETFDMVPVIDSCITMIGERANNGGVELVVDIAGVTPRQLRADRTRIKQVVLNLLSNAVKFTERGGRVTVKAWQSEGNGFVLQVIDTGVGIAADDIPKALARFQQVEGDLNRKHEGTGLGLPLAKSLVERHGGSLDLQSQLGIGTTVTVRLPVVRTILEAA